MYGTKDLVNQYAAQLVVSNLQFGGPEGDPRVTTFHRFLLEEWDTRVLSVFLDGGSAGTGRVGFGTWHVARNHHLFLRGKGAREGTCARLDLWTRHVACGTVCAEWRSAGHKLLLLLEEWD